ncbi:hypothetical protein [Shewanella sp. SR44-3]|uniref:hypothetical protein n=1 Tax=Shewanella sp. SR44-3 TaxID=2760936 RepID=UPI0015FE38F2|nr:hypothetical protein [Shewanella sp. SR44-3]MBB1269525.1 hypothetical protein [Shewanella sp. SR44-3]
MSKLSLLLLCSLSAVVIVGGFCQRHALACELIEYAKHAEYSEISPNVFASHAFNRDQKNTLLAMIELGKSRVNQTFGNMIANPKVIIAANDIEAAEFGANAFGKALLTPLGQCIILGPKGQNIDVVAHEYTHAEVHHRVGWLNHLLNVPIWFNEGVALLVDFREPYLLDNITLSAEQIDAVKSDKFDFSIASYQAARVLVEPLDRATLYDNLEKLTQGQNINSAFALHLTLKE